MNAFWNPLLNELSPYIPGEQPGKKCIKLNTNENPYPPSPFVLEALEKAKARIRLYPNPESEALVEALAHYHQLSKEEIFVGNGSDEILAHAFFALLKHEKPLLLPDVTYSFYPVYAKLYGIKTKTLPLNKNLEIDLNDFEKIDAGGIVLANPNAPTGHLVNPSSILRLCQKQPNIPIVVDEAYIDFALKTDSALPLTQECPNLLVVRTFSKSRAMAGLRLGYAVGNRHLIEALRRVKNSFNSYPVNVLTEKAGIASLEDENYFQKQRQKIIQNREFLSKELQKLRFKVLPSSANFIFAAHEKRLAPELFLYLKENQILVRHFPQPERIANFLRITIGTKEECIALCNALIALLKEAR